LEREVTKARIEVHKILSDLAESPLGSWINSTFGGPAAALARLEAGVTDLIHTRSQQLNSKAASDVPSTSPHSSSSFFEGVLGSASKIHAHPPLPPLLLDDQAGIRELLKARLVNVIRNPKTQGLDAVGTKSAIAIATQIVNDYFGQVVRPEQLLAGNTHYYREAALRERPFISVSEFKGAPLMALGAERAALAAHCLQMLGQNVSLVFGAVKIVRSWDPSFPSPLLEHAFLLVAPGSSADRKIESFLVDPTLLVRRVQGSRIEMIPAEYGVSEAQLSDLRAGKPYRALHQDWVHRHNGWRQLLTEREYCAQTS